MYLVTVTTFVALRHASHRSPNLRCAATAQALLSMSGLATLIAMCLVLGFGVFGLGTLPLSLVLYSMYIFYFARFSSFP